MFENARALPMERRPAYLADACQDNPALRLEVEALLASDERAANFLEAPIVLPDGSLGTSIVPRVPARIGRYVITDTLGEGGMGVVYGALDERLGRPIAVKVLRHESAADPTARERFWREARVAASVNHPHICQLYEIAESDGQLFIAMERLEGEPLSSRLSRGPVPLAETVQTALEVLAALEALHRRGITHRDLKPSNVFLTPHGAKVLDFGVSLNQTEDVTRRPLTQPGAILGTPKYMAPEQVLGNLATASADLFAMGAILYEMLAGAAAFPGDDVHVVMENVLRGQVPVLTGEPAVAAADRVIHRALAKSPENRYASAAAMAEDLRTALLTVRSEDSRPARPATRLMVLPFRLLRPDAEVDLRANPLSHDSGSWEVARDLYLQCLQSDPQYAPAWARLGRVYHVIGKYRGTSEDYARSEAALNRALELNPDLSIADRFYAQLEIGDLFRSREAMVRLVRRASSRGSDPELFAALVPACRYCGLLRQSLAAYERAARLDPNIRTSVQHTLFMLGDYLRAAAEAERRWAPGSTWSLSLACAGHPDAHRVSEIESKRYANTPFRDTERGGTEPDRAHLRAAVDELIASGFRDPEGLFYQAIKLAHAGDLDRAVEILGDVVDRGFYPHATFTRHAWLDPLRMRPDFEAVLEKCERRHLEAHADFVEAGGETLLGMGI